MHTKNVCEMLRVTPKALRVYEQNGLIQPARSSSGYRSYGQAEILRLREILLLKELGFSLADIKGILDRIHAGDDPDALLRSLSFQLGLIGDQMQELSRVREVLTKSIHGLLNPEDNAVPDTGCDRLLAELEQNKARRRLWIDRWDFDRWAPEYDDSVMRPGDGELNLFQSYEQVLAVTAAWVRAAHPARVLDIGCGPGRLCGELSRTMTVVGMDQSIGMLLAAREQHPRLPLRLGNFLDEPYCRGEFDAVVSTFAFHHLQPGEKVTALRHMGGYLGERGRIVIADLMFRTAGDRERCRQELCGRGREDLWAVIDDEYYTIIADLERDARSLGLSFHYEHVVNFTWMIVMDKG